MTDHKNWILPVFERGHVVPGSHLSEEANTAVLMKGDNELKIAFFALDRLCFVKNHSYCIRVEGDI